MVEIDEDSRQQNVPSSQPKTPPRIIIHEKWCKKCGICIAFCPTHVFTADDFGVPIITSPEKCTNCGLCVIRCPEFTIKLEPSGAEQKQAQAALGAEAKKGAA